MNLLHRNIKGGADASIQEPCLGLGTEVFPMVDQFSIGSCLGAVDCCADVLSERRIERSRNHIEGTVEPVVMTEFVTLFSHQ